MDSRTLNNPSDNLRFQKFQTKQNPYLFKYCFQLVDFFRTLEPKNVTRGNINILRVPISGSDLSEHSFSGGIYD